MDESPESIDVQNEGQTEAELAAGLEQQVDQQKRRTKRSQKRQQISADLRFMVSANSQAGGQGVYAGFRFVRASGIDVSPDEELYLGTFLPLNVAAKYPWLMAFKTVVYEDVFVNEQLDPGTRTVVRPGKFRRYRIISLVSKLTSLCWSSAYLAGAFVALVALIKVALWFRRGR